jgi:hypothetical protein
MNNETTQKSWIKRHPYATGAILLILAIIAVPSDKQQQAQVNTSEVKTQEQASSTEPKLSKEQAQKELNEFMKTAIKAQLVSSYDFKEIANNVYRWDIFVDKNWYVMTVPQKKDFIAYIAIRKKAITGYSNFKVTDAYSNEKVGEVTSFSQSIEIYK